MSHCVMQDFGTHRTATWRSSSAACWPISLPTDARTWARVISSSYFTLLALSSFNCIHGHKGNFTYSFIKPVQV